MEDINEQNKEIQKVYEELINLTMTRLDQITHQIHQVEYKLYDMYPQIRLQQSQPIPNYDQNYHKYIFYLKPYIELLDRLNQYFYSSCFRYYHQIMSNLYEFMNTNSEHIDDVLTTLENFQDQLLGMLYGILNLIKSIDILYMNYNTETTNRQYMEFSNYFRQLQMGIDKMMLYCCTNIDHFQNIISGHYNESFPYHPCYNRFQCTPFPPYLNKRSGSY